MSKVSHRLLSWGVEFCIGFDASFLIFHTIPPPRGSVTRQIEFERGGEKKEEIEKAHEKIKKLMASFDIKWDLVIAYGDPVLELVKAAKKIQPDIVIAASHGLSGFQQFLIGSVVGRMAQTLSQPLLVIPSGKIISDANYPKLNLTNIMIACSLLESDTHLKKYAAAFFEKFNTKICLVHVMESPVNNEVGEVTPVPYEEAQKFLEEKLSLRLKKFFPAKTHILHGIPGEELALYAKSHEIDLIIAGGDDHPGRVIATTTASLLRDLPCAVLTVPIKSTIKLNK